LKKTIFCVILERRFP